MQMSKEIKFEEQMKKLQEIVEKLERNDVELDESIALYKEGLKLSKSLKDQLSVFESKIAALNEGEKDGWVETDMAYYKFSPSLSDAPQF